MKTVLPALVAALCIGSICFADDGASGEKHGIEIQAAERVQISRGNLFGQSIRFTGSGRFDSRGKMIRAGLVLDPIADTPFFAGFELWAGQEGDERYHLQSQGRDVFVGAHLSKEIKATLKLENQDVALYHLSNDAPQIFRDSAQINQTGNVSLLVERSTLNDRFYPTKGTQQSLEYAYARDGFLSEISFNRVTFQFRGYTTPGEFFTFAFRTRAGWIEGYGDTGEIPYFERFFNGGTGMVRGYRSRQLGPKDDRNLPLGGDVVWVNNFEIRFPLYKKLSGAYFVDAGGVWPDTRAFRLDDLKCGTGPGLRLATKWGVARLDLGIRLTHEKDEPRAVLHASFGVPF